MPASRWVLLGSAETSGVSELTAWLRPLEAADAAGSGPLRPGRQDLLQAGHACRGGKRTCISASECRVPRRRTARWGDRAHPQSSRLECRTTGRAGDVLPEPSCRGRSRLTAVETRSELRAGAGTVRLGRRGQPTLSTGGQGGACGCWGESRGRGALAHAAQSGDQLMLGA